jgi:DNA-binding protein HU-beta
MNKAELVSAIAEKTGQSKAKVGEVVDALFDIVTDALRNREEVRLPSFGVFEAKHTAERKARNPQTNKEVVVPASVRARFRPGKSLRDALEGPAAPARK